MSAPRLYCSEPVSSDGSSDGTSEAKWLTVPPGHGANDPTPDPLFFPEGDDAANLIVTLASFHDSWRCGHTLKDLFFKAKHRDRVYVGVVDQTADDGSKLGCINAYCVRERGSGSWFGSFRTI